jgi:hypothetical protein
VEGARNTNAQGKYGEASLMPFQPNHLSSFTTYTCDNHQVGQVTSISTKTRLWLRLLRSLFKSYLARRILQVRLALAFPTYHLAHYTRLTQIAAPRPLDIVPLYFRTLSTTHITHNFRNGFEANQQGTDRSRPVSLI